MNDVYQALIELALLGLLVKVLLWWASSIDNKRHKIAQSFYEDVYKEIKLNAGQRKKLEDLRRRHNLREAPKKHRSSTKEKTVVSDKENDERSVR